jgi:GT2 family glycosyltransferase
MISVILLHHDKAEYSRACLRSLARSTARPLEVINVDNGSRDNTPQVLDEWEILAREAGIETRRLAFDSNIGAVRGRNEAMAVARGELIAFLDNDTLVAQADWLERLAEFLEQTPRCAVVAPKMLFPSAPHLIECCGCGVSSQGRIQYIGRGQERGAVSEPFAAQCLISAAWLMRRSLMEEIGVLDEAFSPVQYEDLDFCYRARERGWETWVQPQVELFHFEHTTTAGSGDINFRYVTTKNGILFKKRWGSTFSQEQGPSEAETAWIALEKRGIEDVDTEQLLPPSAVGNPSPSRLSV